MSLLKRIAQALSGIDISQASDIDYEWLLRIGFSMAEIQDLRKIEHLVRNGDVKTVDDAQLAFQQGGFNSRFEPERIHELFNLPF